MLWFAMVLTSASNVALFGKCEAFWFVLFPFLLSFFSFILEQVALRWWIK